MKFTARKALPKILFTAGVPLVDNLLMNLE